jgi:type I restriction enzyme S subunit
LSNRPWTTTKLGECFRIKHGYAFKGEFFSEAGSHVLLTPGNFSEEGGLKLKGEKEKYYSGPIPGEFVLRRGDLLIAMTDLKQSAPILGSAAIVPKSDLFLHNQRLGKVVQLDERRITKEFLFYLFNSSRVRAQIKGSATGTTVRHTAPERIYNVVVCLPPVETQRKIARTLSDYDRLIENNTRRIKILEAMAQALYREWFVNFRFSGHDKMKFVDSPVSKIPKGWDVKKLGDVANTFRGRSYRSEDLAEEGGLPFLNLKCLDRDGGFRRSGLKRYTGEYKDSHVARKGDIVIAVTDMTQERRIIARAALVPTLDREFGISSMDLVRIEPKPPMPEAFLYSFLRYSSFADEVKQHANGVNVLHLAPERITDFRIAVPPADVMQRFADFVAPTLEQMDTLENKSENLRRTRDLLLPKLISGEIEVGRGKR